MIVLPSHIQLIFKLRSKVLSVLCICASNVLQPSGLDTDLTKHRVGVLSQYEGVGPSFVMAFG